MGRQGDDIATSRAPIAVIDDDAGVRAALCNLLASVDQRTCSFADGGSFLAADCLPTVLCAIIDLQLPDMSGVELAERLAQLRPQLPLLLISARAMPCQRHRAAALGLPLLSKPVHADTLLAALRRLLPDPP